MGIYITVVFEGDMLLCLQNKFKVQVTKLFIYLWYSYFYRDIFVSKALNIEKSSR